MHLLKARKKQEQRLAEEDALRARVAEKTALERRSADAQAGRDRQTQSQDRRRAQAAREQMEARMARAMSPPRSEEESLEKH